MSQSRLESSVRVNRDAGGTMFGGRPIDVVVAGLVFAAVRLLLC
jgi:hypothetical protein